jgi:endonuclease/exonuclease/phosphatase family metal-dependent hydrolase
MGNTLTVATFNFRDGGWSKPDRSYRHLPTLGRLIRRAFRPVELDVLFLQECRSWEMDGQQTFLEVEAILRSVGQPLRGFLCPSNRGQLHQAVFINWPYLRPVRHYMRYLPDLFHDQDGWLHVQSETLDRPLKLRSVHWPYAGSLHLREAELLTRHADAESATIIGGDFNEIWPGGAEFEPDWMQLEPHLRHQKTLPPGFRPDGPPVSNRHATTLLAEAGYVNAGVIAENYTPTVNADVDHGQGARIDHILLSPRLVPYQVEGSYQVHVSETGNVASDHRLVSVKLDMPTT